MGDKTKRVSVKSQVTQCLWAGKPEDRKFQKRTGEFGGRKSSKGPSKVGGLFHRVLLSVRVVGPLAWITIGRKGEMRTKKKLEGLN